MALLPGALLATVLVGSGAPLAGQWRSDPPDSDKSLFSIPRSQDDIHEVKLADREIAEGGFASAVERLHALLERDRRGLLPLGAGRYQGMRAAILERLRELPEAGLQAYEKLTNREAGGLVRTAFAGRNPEGLRALAERFPTSSAGRRARLRLGDFWLEAGEGGRATQEYIRLLAAMSARSPRRAAVRQRLAAAQTLARHTAVGAAGGSSDVLELAEAPESGIGWRSYGGGREGASPMALPKSLGADAVRFQLPTPGYRSNRSPRPLTVHAAGGLGGLYFNTGHKVVAYDPIAGRRAWEAPGPLAGAYDADGYNKTLSREMLLSVAVSPDVVVAALQVPNQSRSQSFHQMELLYKLPSRRLFGFDRHSGKRLWGHWDYRDGPRTKMFSSHNAPAPPVVDGETVYAPTTDPTGAIAYYLSAYDLRTGTPKWRTLVCSSQGEVNMFGNAKVEYAGTPVALHEGVLYGTTNLGLCYAADAANGRIRWCTSYPIIPLPRTRMRGQNLRAIFFANNPVIVADGVMMCTPLDSEHVLGLDIENGRILWKLHWRNQANNPNHIKWMLGVLGDELILSGRGVVGAKIRPTSVRGAQVRQIRRPDYFGGLDSRIARGAVTENRIVHPTPEGLFVFDASGNAHGSSFAVQNPGNILMVDGLVVSARANDVQIYLDQEGLIDRARVAIRKERDNPAHYLRLAMLMRGGKSAAGLSGIRGERIIKHLRDGIAAAARAGLGDDAPVMKSLASELFEISTLRADAEAARGARDRALRILRRAQDECRDAADWITAQLKILALSAGSKKKYLEELDRLGSTHGSVVYRFPSAGPMPVQPWVLWKSIGSLPDAATQVARCQQILESYPDVEFERETGREFAVRTIAALIAEHGRGVYAATEARAASRLATAGVDLALLRAIDRRFPHSRAAETARHRVLDQAVLRGDLATAAAMAGRRAAGGAPGLAPGMLRRLMIAAERAGNTPLARALGGRLVGAFAASKSDFPADEGKTMREVVQLPPLPESAPALPHLPSHRVGATISHRGKTHLDILDCEVAPGYPAAGPRLLYVASGINELVAFDVRRSHTEPVFAVKAQLRLHVLSLAERPQLCGDRLILNEMSQIRAVNSRTGADIWTRTAGDKRSFEILGVQSGIVHVFSTLSDHGDGGRILGFDTLSGAQLYSHVFPVMRETIPPRLFAGDLWTLNVPPGAGRVEVHRYDGITGDLRHKFTVPTAIQEALGLRADSSGSIRIRQAQSGLLVDASGIYLCAGDPRSAPVVAAFEHTGAKRWTWRSSSRSAVLKLNALHPTGVVLLEVLSSSRSSSRLVVLDKRDGHEARGAKFDGSARTLDPHPEPLAPDLLLLEIADDSTSLLGYSLDGKVPSFRYNTNQRGSFWRHPVVGREFLAAPLLDSGGIRMELLVIRLSDRRGALPDGGSTLPLPDRPGGFRVVQHGALVLCQAKDGILVLGNAEDAR